jgi:pyruvate carboxylase
MLSPSFHRSKVLYSDNAIYDFSKKAVENGLDIFRVFDSLNYVENVRVHPPSLRGSHVPL